MNAAFLPIAVWSRDRDKLTFMRTFVGGKCYRIITTGKVFPFPGTGDVQKRPDWKSLLQNQTFGQNENDRN